VTAPPEFLVGAGRLALTWAQRRSIGVASTSGVSLALAICAAAWLSDGTRTGTLRAIGALLASYLVGLAGRQLAQAQLAAGATMSVDGTIRDLGAVLGRGGRLSRQRVGLDGARPARWFMSLASSLAECIVYAGLAVGAAAEHWTGMWPLALAVLGVVAVRNLMSATSIPPGFNGAARGVLGKVSHAVLTMPVGGRVLLIAIVAPSWGCRAALLALVDWAIISIGYGIAGRMAPSLGDASSAIVRLRDDGFISRSLGRLARGILLPLPPAILGLVAVTTLAVVGLHGLPGILVIGPAIVMLVAAPGSSNPHTGRFDWLVPVLLVAAQFVYLTGTGIAAHVPGPLIFVLCAALLLHYADLGYPGRPIMIVKRWQTGTAVEIGRNLGWEGRILVAGTAAAMGIATVAYVALAVYVGGLLCAKALTCCLPHRDDEESK